jgi:hypothetical protein
VGRVEAKYNTNPHGDQNSEPDRPGLVDDLNKVDALKKVAGTETETYANGPP